MKFTFFGTGTSQGVPVIGCGCEVCTSPDAKDKRLRVSGLLETDTVNLVFDCGPDFRQQMLRSGCTKVDALLLTHEHNDHVIGLDDVRPLNFLHKKDMVVYALPRVAAEVKQRFAYVFAENKYPGAPMVRLEILNPYIPFHIENLSVTPINVMHGNLPILGYRIADFAYLTDVKTIPAAEFSKLKNLDILVLSALHHTEHHSHLTVEQAVKIARRINARRTYFIHFSHRAGLHRDIEKMLPADMFAAYDGLTIEF